MKTLFKIVLIIVVGELVFQMHKHWGTKEVNDIPDAIPSQIGSLSVNTIFLLGDSYTKGMGVQKANRIVNNIKYADKQVLDYSHSSYNWADYIKVIQSTILPLLKPEDVIVIGVNWNDVGFKNGAIKYLLNPQKDTLKNEHKPEILKKEKPNGLRGIIHFFYRNSAMISFLSSNIQNMLRQKGIPLPIGDFHYYKELAYDEKSMELDMAMSYLQALNEQKEVHTILYLMPDFNLTKRVEYFNDYRYFFKKYNGQNGIIVLDGLQYFADAADGYYCISKHDGHPNDSAHLKIAQEITNALHSLSVNTK